MENKDRQGKQDRQERRARKVQWVRRCTLRLKVKMATPAPLVQPARRAQQDRRAASGQRFTLRLTRVNKATWAHRATKARKALLAVLAHKAPKGLRLTLRQTTKRLTSLPSQVLLAQQEILGLPGPKELLHCPSQLTAWTGTTGNLSRVQSDQLAQQDRRAAWAQQCIWMPTRETLEI